MDKKLLRWNFVFQYGWVLTNILNALILLPLYLKNIDVNTLGIWLATGNILAWMTLVDPGIGEVLQQKIAELRGRKEYSEIGKQIGSGFMASAIILLIAVIFGFIFYFLLGWIINKDVSQYPQLSKALVISIIATGMSLVSFSMSGINQGMHNSAQVAMAALSANFLFLMVNLIFLFLGFGVMSIAFANLCRAIYINIYNITSLLRVLKKQSLEIIFEVRHFKKFIRIFSFTSASKIITGLSNSIDMIVLARFIPPVMITLFEINKRPVNITQSLIGRHSVALMPLISHAKGMQDKKSIISLINRQFKFYAYAAIFTAFIFIFNYNNLITAWTGPSQYAGNTIMFLLVANFFFGLIGYFMSNMGYALGDIKRNSLVYIIRGFCLGTLMYFAARRFGIVGTLSVSLFMSLVTDFCYFTFRLYKIGYLQPSLIRSTLKLWVVIIPLSALGGWCFEKLLNGLLPTTMYFGKLMINSGLFFIFFIVLILIVDSDLRNSLKDTRDRIFVHPFYKKVTTGFVKLPEEADQLSSPG